MSGRVRGMRWDESLNQRIAVEMERKAQVL
jgi:hypothetical protein